MLNKGVWTAAGAYTIWGMFPVYWKWLQHVPALQSICHRIVWSCLILLSVLVFIHRSRDFRIVFLTPTVIRTYVLAAVLIAVNWLVYIWSVNSGYIVEASLGYFINPLLSILMGVIFLRERLRAWQWLPIGLSAAGVLYLTLAYGRPPWIALTLATSFGLYGLVKKTAPLGSFLGLLIETGILFVPAVSYLLYADHIGQGAFLHTGTVSDLLMVGAGLITTVPLLMFASALKQIPLFLVGILQYITPTLQFLLGVLVYHEPFSHSKLIGFGCVWMALVIFGMEGYLAGRGKLTATT
jgi:chloramphenicol-sensitive protein RarD